MSYQFIRTLNLDELVTEITKAQKEVIYSSKNLHNELSEALCRVAKNGVKIKVIIDPSEANYRNGFGEITTVSEMQTAGVNVFELKGNEVTFIIVDETGYFFFPQSRMFTAEAEGPNAILMDEVTRIRLIAHYFPPEDNRSKDEIINQINKVVENATKAIDLLQEDFVTEGRDSVIKKIDEGNLAAVRQNLKRNPPLHPDLKRRINTYAAKIQFVELKFIGSNYNVVKITIPKKALPFKNTELLKLLETKMRLFAKIEDNPDLKRLENIKKQVESLRIGFRSEKNNLDNLNFPGLEVITKDGKNKTGFIIPITSREKSIIKVEDKPVFEEELKKLRNEVNELKQKASDAIERDILHAKEAFKTELIEFLKRNPPEEYIHFSKSTLLDKIEDYAASIIAKIHFPDSIDLLKKLTLKCHYYDLTFEDFKDNDLLNEFRKKNILREEELTDIVQFTNAFAAVKLA